MSEVQIYGVCGAVLIGVGLYGAILGRSAVRRLLSFNLMGAGAFLVFGVIARRGGLAAGVASDPVPQALVITGLVVAFAATALAVGLLLRLAAVEREEASAVAHPASSGDSSADALASPSNDADPAAHR